MQKHIAEGLLQAQHLGRRHALRRFRQADDQAGILRREKTFRYLDEHEAGHGQRREEYAQRRKLVPQNDGEAAAIAVVQGIESRFDEAIEPPVPVRFPPHEARAQHRRQSQRDECRNSDGRRHCQGKFPEHPSDDPPHEQQRDEDGDQRQAD